MMAIRFSGVIFTPRGFRQHVIRDFKITRFDMCTGAAKNMCRRTRILPVDSWDNGEKDEIEFLQVDGMLYIFENKAIHRIKLYYPPQTPQPDILPDLIPFNPGGMASFCDGPPDRSTLWVYVKNQGEGPAPASTTRVEFSLTGGRTHRVDMQTDEIPVDTYIRLEVSMPGDCWNPDCSFKIIVDYYNAINEKEETNNTEYGNCIG